jgi:TonB family protein
MSGVLKHALLIIVGAGVAAAVCGASARAATEFCPAAIDSHYTKGPASQGATEYYYRLSALGPRVVDGTIVAETDRGWFVWKQLAVQLTPMTFTYTDKELKYSHALAESPELSVTFPQALVIRHAWLAFARSQGDPYFGWDARGMVACTPPDFGTSAYPPMGKTLRTPRATDPTPGPAPPTAIAAPAAAPFPAPTCAHPFAVATVTYASQPLYPSVLKNEGFVGRAVSQIAVALDTNGKLVDAWVFASSGYPQFDAAAMDAARRSKYSAPISYCYAVKGTYLFRADFEAPNGP